MLNRLALAPDLGHGFVPIHLRLAAPVVDLRHECLPRCESELLLASLHITAHRRFRHTASVRSCRIRSQMRCAVWRCLRGAVCVRPQNLVNELHHRTQPGLVSHRQFAFRRNRARQRLSHHPPMHAQFLRDRTNRARSMGVFPPDLFE